MDVGDIMTVASCYGAKAGDANYNPAYDINGNGEIDVGDIMAVAAQYGVNQ